MQFGDEFILILGEAFARIEELIEATDKRFVAGAQTSDDRTETGLDLSGIFTLEVVVDQDDHGKRKRVGSKESDLLFDLVFKNTKFIFFQIGNQVAAAILDRDGQKNEGRIQNDFESGRARRLEFERGR